MKKKIINVDEQKKIVSKNLNNLLSKYGKTVSDVSRDLGIPDATVRSWFNGSKYPRIDKVQLLADYFHVTRSGITEKSNHGIERVTKTVQIPVIGDIACGDPITAEENIQSYREEISDRVPTGEIFYLKCKGNSMEPTIPDGSFVLIKSQPEVEDGEIAAVLVDDDSEATLKRVRHQGSLVMLMPDNTSEYKPIILTETNPGRIIGKAVRISIDL